MNMMMKTVLRMTFLAVFVGWLMVWVLLPTKIYKQAWTPVLHSNLNSTYFGVQGCLSNFSLVYVFFFLKKKKIAYCFGVGFFSLFLRIMLKSNFIIVQGQIFCFLHFP
jgi:hypothetical protein